MPRKETILAAPVSVVIPTLNAEAHLGPTLMRLAEGLTEGLIREVIFADGGSDDGTAEIAAEAGARLVEAPKSRGRQLIAGCEAANGSWLLVIHADSRLPEGWPALLRDHMERHPRDAGHFRLGFDCGGLPARLTAGWANLRSRLFALPYGDQGLLIPRRLYHETGGYPPLPLMEDVALVRSLRGRLHLIPGTMVTSAMRYRRDGWLRRGWRNLSTLALYLMGVDTFRLAERYERAVPAAAAETAGQAEAGRARVED